MTEWDRSLRRGELRDCEYILRVLQEIRYMVNNVSYESVMGWAMQNIHTQYTNRWHKHKSTDNNGAKLTHHFFFFSGLRFAHSVLVFCRMHAWVRPCVMCVCVCAMSRSCAWIHILVYCALLFPSWNINQTSIRFMFGPFFFLSVSSRRNIEANILYLIILFRQSRRAAPMHFQMTNAIVRGTRKIRIHVFTFPDSSQTHTHTHSHSCAVDSHVQTV